MKLILKIVLFFLFSITFNISKADNLTESLKAAYLNNHKLNAERANVRAVNQRKKEALSEFMPSVTISGYVSEQDNTKGTESNFEPSEQSLLIEQKIFQGLGGVANYKKQKMEYSLAEFKLKKVEQEILLSAAEVHLDFLLSKKKLNINMANIDLLDRQVETDKNRLEKGEISLADLAQSEASLAGARAKLITAQNDLVTSKVNFEKIVGQKPRENIYDNKLNIIWLPRSLSEAYKISKGENPDLQIASLEFEKSKQDVLIAGSDFAPTATLSYKLAEQDDMSSTITERTQQTLKATATWPLFSGGSNYFSLREAQENRNNKELLLKDSQKLVETEVAKAWSNYQSSKSVLNSIRAQVEAAEIANEGITLEYESGGNKRTTLDVIQSSAMLLESKINLAESEKNFLISQFNVLSVIGRLTAKQLKLIH